MVSRAFAEPNSPERFACGRWQDDEHNIPYLVNAQAAIFSVKSKTVTCGSHAIFIGNVYDTKIREDISPLLYQNGGYGICEPLRQEPDAQLAQLMGWG
jgi:flavin reductase